MMDGGAAPGSSHALDRLAVETALYLIAAALDEKNWDALSEAFTPDATGYGRHGRAAIVTQVRAHLGGFGPSQHLLGNVRVEVHGDSARSSAYARVHHQGAGTQAGNVFECMGRYTDHWQRSGEGWLLTSRSFDVTATVGEWAVLQPG